MNLQGIKLLLINKNKIKVPEEVKKEIVAIYSKLATDKQTVQKDLETAIGEAQKRFHEAESRLKAESDFFRGQREVKNQQLDDVANKMLSNIGDCLLHCLVGGKLKENAYQFSENYDFLLKI